MAQMVYEEDNIRAVAERIREKTGTETTYTTAEMRNGVDEVYNKGYEIGYDRGYGEGEASNAGDYAEGYAAGVAITNDANATAEDMVSGTSAWVKGEKVDGSIKRANGGITAYVTAEKNAGMPYVAMRHTITEPTCIAPNTGGTISLNSPLEDFGNSTKEDVAAGKTFTSAAGFKEVGTAKTYNEGYSDGMSQGHSIGYDAGRQAEHNEFWQGVFTGGVKPYHFTGKAWNDNTFYPTEDIKPIGDAYYLFHLCNISDLAGRLRECGVTLDTSGITNRADNMFAWSDNLTTVPYLDLRNAKYAGGILANVFAYCGKLHTIEGIHLAEDGSQNLGTNIFGACSSLVNLTIYGIISTGSINLSYSTKLSKASITSVINALSTTTSGLSITLSKTAVETAFPKNNGLGNVEWGTLVAKRSNWTINLV